MLKLQKTNLEEDREMKKRENVTKFIISIIFQPLCTVLQPLV